MVAIKRGLVFVGLKVAEISGVIGLPYLIGRFTPYTAAKLMPIFNLSAATYWKHWANGLTVVATVVVGLVLATMILAIAILVVGALGKWNWELAKKILQKRGGV